MPGYLATWKTVDRSKGDIDANTIIMGGHKHPININREINKTETQQWNNRTHPNN